MRTAARDLIAYIGTLTLAGGDCDGERFTVLPWEARFLRGMLGNPGDSALSVARGNGKSALVAGISCAVLDPAGPLHGRRREVVVCASSFAQARIIFEDVDAIMRAKAGDLREGLPRPRLPEHGDHHPPGQRRAAPVHRIGPTSGSWASSAACSG